MPDACSSFYNVGLRILEPIAVNSHCMHRVCTSFGCDLDLLRKVTRKQVSNSYIYYTERHYSCTSSSINEIIRKFKQKVNIIASKLPENVGIFQTPLPISQVSKHLIPKFPANNQKIAQKSNKLACGFICKNYIYAFPSF